MNKLFLSASVVLSATTFSLAQQTIPRIWYCSLLMIVPIMI